MAQTEPRVSLIKKSDYSSDYSKLLRNIVSAYKDNTILWDSSHPDFHNRGKRDTVWQELAEQFNIDTLDLKKKIQSLTGSYRRERSRVRKSQLKGSNRHYKSRWFAFNWLKFLDRNAAKGKLENVEINSTEDPSNQQILTDENDTNERLPKACILRKRIFHKLPPNSSNAAPVSYDKRETVTTNHEDEFDAFGRNVSLQLKQLPIIHALECQEQIQRVLKEHRIKALQEQRDIEVVLGNNSVDPLSGSTFPDVIRLDKTEPVEFSDSEDLCRYSHEQ